MICITSNGGEKRAYVYIERNDFGKLLTITESRWRVFLYLKFFHNKMGKIHHF